MIPIKASVIIIASTIGSLLGGANIAKAAPATCKYEGVPAATCEIKHLHIKAGWKDEVLVDPNGTMRRFSRKIGFGSQPVHINLYLPGQSTGSFHQGTHVEVGEQKMIYTQDGGSYPSRGNRVIIYVDSGKFSYTL